MAQDRKVAGQKGMEKQKKEARGDLITYCRGRRGWVGRWWGQENALNDDNKERDAERKAEI